MGPGCPRLEPRPAGRVLASQGAARAVSFARGSSSPSAPGPDLLTFTEWVLGECEWNCSRTKRPQRGSAAWRPAPSSVTLFPAHRTRHVCLFTSLDTGAGQPCVHAGVGLPCAGWATEAGLSPRFPGGRGAATLHSGAAPWPLQRIWGLLDTWRLERAASVDQVPSDGSPRHPPLPL